MGWDHAPRPLHPALTAVVGLAAVAIIVVIRFSPEKRGEFLKAR
jgi:hypothetical protein